MRSEEDVKKAIYEYSDTIKRICVLYLKSPQDTEDIMQNVFIKYAMRDTPFESDGHRKSWLIKVAVNSCRDILKSFYRKKVTLTDVIPETAHMAGQAENDTGDEDGRVLEAVLSLPDKYKEVIYLKYFEGYDGAEMAEITGRSRNSVYKLLDRGRRMLADKLGGDDLE